jgi:hypothetical protein
VVSYVILAGDFLSLVFNLGIMIKSMIFPKLISDINVTWSEEDIKLVLIE